MTDAKTARDVLKDSLPRPRWIAYPDGREKWADQQIAALHAAGYHITSAAPVSAVGADDERTEIIDDMLRLSFMNEADARVAAASIYDTLTTPTPPTLAVQDDGAQTEGVITYDEALRRKVVNRVAPSLMGRMMKIADFIAELQQTLDRFGNTCVYINDVSWGAVALNRQSDDAERLGATAEWVKQLRINGAAADAVAGAGRDGDAQIMKAFMAGWDACSDLWHWENGQVILGVNKEPPDVKLAYEQYRAAIAADLAPPAAT